MFSLKKCANNKADIRKKINRTDENFNNCNFSSNE